MSQTNEDTEVCYLCNKYYPKGKIDTHIELHITDSNTPAPILEDGKYIMQSLPDYSLYTTYAQLLILRKFFLIQLPTPEIFDTLHINNDL